MADSDPETTSDIEEARHRLQLYRELTAVEEGTVLEALSGVKQHAGLLGAMSVLGLLWSGTGLFASMEFALTQIFGTKKPDAEGLAATGPRKGDDVPSPAQAVSQQQRRAGSRRTPAHRQPRGRSAH